MAAGLEKVVRLLTVPGLLLLGPLAAQCCSCLDKSLCDKFEYASVVARVKAVQRTTLAEDFADVTYDVEVITLYKSETDVEYDDEISFSTGANGGLCGVYLELGDEYLVDLSRSDTDGELRAVGSCGLHESWNLVTAEDLEKVEDGCEDSIEVAGEVSSLTEEDIDDESSSAPRLVQGTVGASCVTFLAICVVQLLGL